MGGRESDLRERLAPVVEAQGADLVEVALAPAGRGTIVRLVIHAEAGVTHGDCARVARAVGDLLEADDVFPGRWNLEVSSPGTDRRIREPREFAIFRGRPVRVVVGDGDEVVEIRGRCDGFRDDDVVVREDDGRERTISWAAVKKARLVPEVPGRDGGEGRER